ncbi:Hypothetical protein CINCED_3A019720 [Cinara cedri]|uniref:Uncharacterized protein n=1 Tax=Cinara cedri TaxID=506608 RepID=A0A5E4MK44_9HEMI|nr:Hypothetical protein CINCED_3A019720 [Cinara cedri]
MTASGLVPKIIPMYDGQELKINQKLVMDGLSTISIRNMHKINNKSAITKRNSFFNLHRPELKGLNILANVTKSQKENKLQKRILKEVKTLDNMNSKRLLHKHDLPQCLTPKIQSKSSYKKVKSDSAQSMGNSFSKRSSLVVKTKMPIRYDCLQKMRMDSNNYDMELEVSSSASKEDKSSCVYDVEIKSTLIN